MEFDPDNLKAAFIWLLKALQLLETELMASKAVLANGLPAIPKGSPLTEQVADLLKEPQVHEAMKKKYAPIFAALEKGFQDRALLELLARWKPEGKPN